MKKNVIKEKSFQFALNVIKLYKAMIKEQEFVLSRQILKSGTSIGANVEEAGAAQTKKDFIMKMSIASKEARETLYWLKLIEQSQLIEYNFNELRAEIKDIVNILTSIVKTAQTNMSR